MAIPPRPEEEPEDVDVLDELLLELEVLELLEDDELELLLELLEDELEFEFVLLLLLEPLLQAVNVAVAIIRPNKAGLNLHTRKSLIYYLSYYHIYLRVKAG